MLLKHLLEVTPRVGDGMFSNLLRSPRHDDLTTLVTALRTCLLYTSDAADE